MPEYDPARDAERVSEEVARRLLARASELEAARGTELSVAELREVAREAGITSVAFEQALAEFRHGADAHTSPALARPTRLQRMARLWPAALILATVLSVLFLRLIVSAP